MYQTDKPKNHLFFRRINASAVFLSSYPTTGGATKTFFRRNLTASTTGTKSPSAERLNNPENIPGDFPDIVADTRNVTVKYQLMRHSLIVQSTRCYSDASGGVVEVTAVDE